MAWQLPLPALALLLLQLDYGACPKDETAFAAMVYTAANAAPRHVYQQLIRALERKDQQWRSACPHGQHQWLSASQLPNLKFKSL